MSLSLPIAVFLLLIAWHSSDVMVIGGDTDKRDGSDVEIINLQPGLPRCPKPADLPVEAQRMVAAYINGKVTVCGGTTSNGTSSQTAGTCYEFVNGSWNSAPYRMNDERRAAAGVVLKNGTWLVMGGYLYPASGRSEVLENGQFHKGHNLPVRMLHHCAVSINSSHFFVGDNNGVFLVNVDKWEWTEVKGIYTADFLDIQCGLAKSKKNGLEVVMVEYSRTHILNLNTMSWRLKRDGGPRSAAAVQHGDTFLLIGGIVGNDKLKDIWEYDPDGSNWIKKRETLATGRDSHAAVAIPECP